MGLAFFGNTLLPDRDLAEIDADAQKTGGTPRGRNRWLATLAVRFGKSGGVTAATARIVLGLQVARRGGVRPLLPVRWRRRRGAWQKSALSPCIGLFIGGATP